MLKKILFALLAVVALILIYAAIQPSHFRVSRELAINATPEQIFPYINDSKKMDSWNPWSEMDPAAKMTYSGPEAGVGAKTSWEGGKQLGTGSATVIESVPNKSVKTLLEYVKPFQMTQTAEISLTPNDQKQTVVKWSVEGNSAFPCRVVCVFMNMDKMVGGTFEKGLAKLKSIVEAPATK